MIVLSKNYSFDGWQFNRPTKYSEDEYCNYVTYIQRTWGYQVFTMYSTEVFMTVIPVVHYADILVDTNTISINKDAIDVWLGFSQLSRKLPGPLGLLFFIRTKTANAIVPGPITPLLGSGLNAYRNILDSRGPVSLADVFSRSSIRKILLGDQRSQDEDSEGDQTILPKSVIDTFAWSQYFSEDYDKIKSLVKVAFREYYTPEIAKNIKFIYDEARIALLSDSGYMVRLQNDIAAGNELPECKLVFEKYIKTVLNNVNDELSQRKLAPLFF